MKMKATKQPRMDKGIQYALLGQTTAYCEQVKAGAKLCAQLICTKENLSFVLKTIRREGCKGLHEGITAGASAVFIYKYDFVKQLVHDLLIMGNKGKPGVTQIWSTGKLFGYSDIEISKYLKAHGYLKKRSRLG